METIDEAFLRELAILNPGNKKLLDLIRRVYKEIMNLRRVLAVRYDALDSGAFL